MDQKHSFRLNLVEWLKEIIPFNQLDTYVRKTREGFDDNPHADRHANHVSYKFVTAKHSYHISATPTYLGCTVSATFFRPGENWTRGNDLPDGKFSRETWEAIKDAIIRYELLKLDPLLPTTPTSENLRLQGNATDHIWGMVHADKEGTDVIGLRFDCGDAGTLYLSKAQAHETIDTLNALLQQLTEQEKKCCRCTCLHTVHPVANHSPDCPEYKLGISR